jgi:hypothetical protein
MNLVNRVAVMGILALVLLCGGGDARAADNHYALVGIRNPTNLTITYSFKWGEHGEWRGTSWGRASAASTPGPTPTRTRTPRRGRTSASTAT